MPTYEFACDNCGTVINKDQDMWEDHTPPICSCGERTRRLYQHNYIADELKSTTYFCPDRRAKVKDHGRVFDTGLGEWYETKSERRRLMKEKNVIEHGPEHEV